MLSMHTKHDGVVFADVSLSTMERPHSGPTTLVIVVQPVPGKYARAMLYEALTFPKRVTEDLDSFHFPKGSTSTEC